MITRAVAKGLRAGTVLFAVLAVACSSSTELEGLRTQLSALELEILELRKEGPSKAEIAALEASLMARLEELVRSEGESRADLGALATEIRQLEGMLEETNFRLQQLGQQIAATNQELQAVRSAAEEARASARARQQPAVNPADPRALYDTAYNDYLQGNFDLAILAFRQYVETYRGTDLADNAAYWIGECFYSQGNYQQAIEQFDVVLSRFEGSDRTPSALLKKGYAYLQLGQRAQGVVHLQTVICEHAATDEAQLASQRLQELGIDVEC